MHDVLTRWAPKDKTTDDVVSRVPEDDEDSLDGVIYKDPPYPFDYSNKNSQSGEDDDGGQEQATAEDIHF